MEDVMESMSHREYRTRVTYLEEKWRTPDRSDFYLMQIAQEVRRVLSKTPNKIKLDHFKIKFEDSQPSQAEQQKKAKRSKSIWEMILGRKAEKPDA